MKKIVFVLAIAILCAATMDAQPPRRQRPQGPVDPALVVKARVDRLDKALNLTEEQKTEISKIYAEEMEAMKKDRPPVDGKMEQPTEQDEAAMKAQREQIRAQHEASDAKIALLLTEEQAAKFAEMKAHQKEGKGMRGHGPGHGPKAGKPGKPGKHEKMEGCNGCDKKCSEKSAEKKQE